MRIAGPFLDALERLRNAEDRYGKARSEARDAQSCLEEAEVDLRHAQQEFSFYASCITEFVPETAPV